MRRSTREKIGAKYGRLTIVAMAHPTYLANGKKRSMYECRCECGETVVVIASNVLNSHTQSCGCLQRERTSEANATHRLFRTTEHTIWVNMVQRCTNKNNPAYKNYGGRGITICDRWLMFENFLADMGARPEGLTLERLNNELGYYPANCTWATRGQQARNRRGNKNYKERYSL